MKEINTTVIPAQVKIEGEIYDVAERTVTLLNKLMALGTQLNDRPLYEFHLAALREILGQDAFDHLFTAGDDENVDRIQLIYDGVMEEFTGNEKRIQAQQVQAATDQVRAVFNPINDMLRRVQALNVPQVDPSVKRIHGS